MSTELERDIAVYEDNLAGLELSSENGGLDGDEIISMFTYRDTIQKALESDEICITDIFKVVELDEQLRKRADIVVQRVDLASWREVTKPRKSHWWWYLDHLVADRIRPTYRPKAVVHKVAEAD